MTRFDGILFFGPPSVGKGTVGKALAREPSVFHYVASGDLVRKIFREGETDADVRKKSDLLHSYIDNGILIPDEVIVPIFKEEVVHKAETRQYNPYREVLLIDGMYRTPAQARMLEDCINILEVYNFTNVPNCKILERRNGRASKEIREGRSPRTDDTDKAFMRRIDDFFKITYPSLDYFVEKNIPIHCVDALPEEHVVVASVRNYAHSKITSYLCKTPIAPYGSD